MSIYCTTFEIGGEHGGSPIAYQGSHVLPSDADLRDGCFSLGAIPGHIDGEGFPVHHPWLRVSIFAENDSTVLLTKKQVTALRDELNRWLGNTEAKEE